MPDDNSHSERAALLFGIAAVLLWSTVATGFKLGLAVMAPVQLLWLGASISFVFFGACFLTTRAWRRWPARFAPCVALGVANPVVYYLVLFEAYDRLPAQVAQPLNYTWSITLAVLAVPILKQPLERRTLAGIAVSYLGVVVLVTQGGASHSLDIDALGVGLALASTVVWAGYWLATVRLDTDPIITMTISFGTGALLLTPICFVTTGLPAWTPEHLFYGGWVGLVEMGIAFLLWQTALNRTGNAARIGALIYLSPCISLVLIARVLGEPIEPASIIGLVVILAGLIVIRRRA